MQAIIMAGGEGVRLRPMTAYLPKPLVPVLGTPLMEYTMKLLKKHGMDQIGVTLWYRPNQIHKAFGKGEKQGVKLRFFEERIPMGTAGSVTLAKKQIKDTFFVLSGDGLTDCDLTSALQFHRQKKALATLVLKRVSIPLSYGVVMTDQDQRIVRFIEKPDWTQVYSNLVNTGVYILEPEIFEYISPSGAPDFGKDVFPMLLSGGLPVYGYETEGYWCDVGNQKAYLQSQQDLLSGKVDLPHFSGVHESAILHAGVRIEGLSMIGAGAEIHPGAIIRGSVIGEGCVIGSSAVIENACLWANVHVQEKARITGSVICDEVLVRQGADIGEGCALGKRSVAAKDTVFLPGTAIAPYRKTLPGAVVSPQLTEPEANTSRWTDQGAECENAETACALCRAFAKATGAKRILAGSEKNDGLEAIAAGAFSALGIRVIACGSITESMLKVLIRTLRLDGGFYATDHALIFFGSNGLPLPEKEMREIDTLLLRQELPPFFVEQSPIIHFAGAADLYLSAVLTKDIHKPLLSPLAVFCNSAFLSALLSEGLKRINARNVRFSDGENVRLLPGETGITLQSSGDWTLFDHHTVLTREQKIMLLLSLFYQTKGKLYDLPHMPRSAEKIAALEEMDQGDGCFLQQILLEDGVAGLLWAVNGLKNGTLSQLMEKLPETHIQNVEIPCSDRDKSRILNALCSERDSARFPGRGIRLEHKNGVASVMPDPYRGIVHIAGESQKSEFARELCDFYKDKIVRLIQKTE